MKVEGKEKFWLPIVLALIGILPAMVTHFIDAFDDYKAQQEISELDKKNKELERVQHSRDSVTAILMYERDMAQKEIRRLDSLYKIELHENGRLEGNLEIMTSNKDLMKENKSVIADYLLKVRANNYENGNFTTD